jgi:hypothetical protein
MDSEKPIIFISCGQVTAEEKALGLKIREAIDNSGIFQGYFAENQSSLEGVTQHIFAQLERCFGLVCVMHARGEVSSPYGTTVRASVWIEQEIAIAAFITGIQGRKIRIRVYLQKGIHREGVRDKVLINPKEFETGDEILTDLPLVIHEWSQEFAGQETTTHREVLENLLLELRDNAELLALDLSQFQSLSDESYLQLKKAALKELAPTVQQSIKQAYRDIATYHTHLRTMENIQNYGFRANHVTMYVGPAKIQARRTVGQAIAVLEDLLSG